MHTDCSIADKEYELYQKQKQLEKCEKRAKGIDRYFRKTYEDNVCGKITDEQYFKLTEGYEAEIAKETERLTAEIHEKVKTDRKNTQASVNKSPPDNRQSGRKIPFLPPYIKILSLSGINHLLQ